MANVQNSVNHEDEARREAALKEAALKDSVNNRLYELEKTHQKEAAYLREAVANSSQGYPIINEMLKLKATDDQLAKFAQFAMKHQAKGNEATDADAALLERMKDNFSRMTFLSAVRGTGNAAVTGAKGLVGGIDKVGRNAPDIMVLSTAFFQAAGILAGGAAVGASIASGGIVGLIGLYALYKGAKAAGNLYGNKVKGATPASDNSKLTDASLTAAWQDIEPELSSSRLAPAPAVKP